MAQLQRAQPQAKCHKLEREKTGWPQHSQVGQRVGAVIHVALLSQMGGVQIWGSVVVGYFSQEELALSLTAVHGPLTTASWEIQMNKTGSEKLNEPQPSTRNQKSLVTYG